MMLPRSLVLPWVVFLLLSLTWTRRVSQASVYHHTGMCMYETSLLKPGQTFSRGCDKCFCHPGGFICSSPMKPTSWPKKCKRIANECGYGAITRSRNARAYSYVV